MAVHVTVWRPGVVVSVASQPLVAMPDVESVASGEAVTPVWFRTTLDELSVGHNSGGAWSTLKVALTTGLSTPLSVSILAA